MIEERESKCLPNKEDGIAIHSMSEVKTARRSLEIKNQRVRNGERTEWRGISTSIPQSLHQRTET